MAAIRNHSPFAARPGYAQQGQQQHQVRSFRDAVRSAEEEDSDGYSLDARSEGSKSSNSNNHVQPATQRLRPNVQTDNLALKSPLEQLSRTLSFNRDRDNAQKAGKGKGRAVERSDRGQQLQDDTENNKALRRPPPLLKASTSKGSSFLELEAESPTQQTSSSSANRYRQQQQSENETRIQPVRFSDDDGDNEGYSQEEDNSDAQSQLINAFRSSYGTHLTREGGVRDSSYSWMHSDPESPNVTMDFQQAQAVFDAAHHRGSSSRPGSVHSPLAGVQADNHLGIGRRNEAGLSATYSEWDGGMRAKARASSWDSTAAQAMDLHRIPSQQGTGRHRKGTNVSSSKDTDDEAGKSSSQNEEKQPAGPGRESGLSAFDPFQYASYESAPNSDDHSRVEDLDIPFSNAMQDHPALRNDQYPAATSAHPTSGLQAIPSQNRNSTDEEVRPDSVYAYPLTPPSLDIARFEDAETPSTGASDTPKITNAQHRARSQVPTGNYSRPYHSRFTQQSQQQESSTSHLVTNGYIHNEENGPTSATLPPPEMRQRYQSSVYPDSPNNGDQQFDTARQAGYEDQPPMPSYPSAEKHKQQQQQLGVAHPFNPSASYSHPSNAPRAASPFRSVSNPQATASSPAPFSKFVDSNIQRPAFDHQYSLNSFNSPLFAPQPQFSRPGLSTSNSSSSSAFMSPTLSSSSTRPSDGGVKRSPSTVLASAMAKHRAQREAAGLTTDGQYYVDPKTGKHYFVAHNRAGASRKGEGKENDRRGAITPEGKESKKGRRKLYKKESGWEVSKVNPATLAVKQQELAQQQQRPPMQHHRSGSTSAFSVHSESDDGGNASGLGSGFVMPKKWKPWATKDSKNRSVSSREGTPESSPVNRSEFPRTKQQRQERSIGETSLGNISQPDENAEEWLWEQQQGQNQVTPNASTRSIRVVRSPGYAADAYGGMMGASPSSSAATQHIPRFETTHPGGHTEPGYFGSGSNVQNGTLLSAAPVHSSPLGQAPRPNLHDRSGSLYSNYSYYNLPESDTGHRSPSTSPGPGRAFAFAVNGAAREGSASPTTLLPSPNVPMASPYIPPNGAEFQPHYPVDGNDAQATSMNRENGHSRQPSTTLDKMKASVQRTASIQLLAQSKHANLTVPKVSGPGGKNEVLDLSKLDPSDPLACLHLGIDAHERGELEKSAEYFQKSADGGCGLGMLMYGLTLRHGWGCESEPEKGFQYLQRAAESVVKDLDRVISGQIQLSEQEFKEQAAKSELVLSIYELGQCFLRGWGVSKDKKTALQYFELAANLGDPDAQSELGFCYSTGRGCKKDLKKAAKYYRLAAGQGMISYGMQWIYKPKYDD